MSTTELKASIEPVIAAVETVVLADVAALAPRAELTFMQFVKEAPHAGYLRRRLLHHPGARLCVLASCLT